MKLVHRPFTGTVVAVGLGTCLLAAMTSVPAGAHALPDVARQAMLAALRDWHTTEPVNEVVYGTRGFDTFGETFLLLAAVVAVVSVCRGREPRRTFLQEERIARREQAAIAGHHQAARGAGVVAQSDRDERDPDTPLSADDAPLGRHGRERSQSMTVPIRVAVRLVLPVLLMAGLYLVAWGYSPGGGFPAGAVILGGVLFVYAAYGYRRIRALVRPDLLEGVEVVGALLIVAIEVLGLVLKGSMSANWLPLGKPQTILSGGVLQAFSGGELIEVSTGLLLVVFSLLAIEREWTEEESRH